MQTNRGPRHFNPAPGEPGGDSRTSTGTLAASDQPAGHGSGGRDVLPPLVSVCMPAYNVARVARDALMSVLAQTYPRLEVIVVDDASTDGTPDAVRAIADPRIRCVRNEQNRGGFQTMNHAVSLARGDFIAVYHTDDIYEPTIVEKEVVHLLSHPQVGAVFSLDHYIDESGRIYGGTTLPPEFQTRESLRYEDVFPFLLRRKNILLRCPTFMMRREVLDAIGPFDPETYDIAADVDMWIRILRRFPISILNERLMRYRHGTHQWSHRYKSLRTDEERFFAVMDHYLATDGWRAKLPADTLVEYAFHRCDDATFRAANLIIRGEPQRARDCLRQPFPWRTFLIDVRRRKLRVVLLRALIRAGLAVRAVHTLARILAWTEYGGLR